MNQLYKWRQLFFRHKQEWLGILEDSEVSGLDFLLEIVWLPEFSLFSGNFISKTARSFSRFNRRFSNQYVCPKCGKTKMQHISFKAPGHRITEELLQYTCDLLSSGNYTNKEVAELTGLGKNTVKAIDKNRLQDLYTIQTAGL